MAKRKNKDQGIKRKLVSSLNTALIPAEYSYKAFKKLFNKLKKVAPLVYEEVDALIKSNIVTVDKRKKIFKKTYLAELGNTITSSLIKKIPSMDERQ
ncbi:MAG: hypothetical protein QGI89_01255, partial [Candidatus Woesearchaeota archaeon]|nr:hypothetical protein [Candidatus Woesearchaeota archaeon]